MTLRCGFCGSPYTTPLTNHSDGGRYVYVRYRCHSCERDGTYRVTVRDPRSARQRPGGARRCRP